MNSTGLVWNGGRLVVHALGYALQVVIVARYCGAEAMGVFTLGMVVFGIGKLFADAGFSSAIVYFKEMGQVERSTLWSVNLLLGAGATLVMTLISPILAWSFQVEELDNFIRYQALVFLIVALGQVHYFLYFKDLQFKVLALIEGTSVIVGTVVLIVLVQSNPDIMDFITAALVSAGLKSCLCLGVGWRQWPVALQWRLGSIKHFFRFGGFQMGSNLLGYLAGRLDPVIVGWFFPQSTLGHYGQAGMIAFEPLQRINPIFTTFAFPVMAKAKDESPLKPIYLGLISACALASIPVIIGIALEAKIIVGLVLGPEWLTIVPLIQILALSACVRVLAYPAASLVTAVGAVEKKFWYEVVLLCVLGLGLSLAGLTGNLFTVCWTLAAISATQFFAVHWLFVRPYAEFRWADWLQALRPMLPVLALLALGRGLTWLWQPDLEFLALLAYIPAAGFYFLSLIRFLRQVNWSSSDQSRDNETPTDSMG